MVLMVILVGLAAAVGAFGCISLMKSRTPEQTAQETPAASRADELLKAAKEAVKYTTVSGEITETTPPENAAHPYFDFIKAPLIKVNLSELRQQFNRNIAGWLEITGTDLKLPYLQGKDNDFYIKHTLDGAEDIAGWPFLDSWGETDLTGRNNLIRVEGALEDTGLNQFMLLISNGWMNEDDNFIIKTATDAGSALWEVFAIYQTDDSSAALETDLQTDWDFLEYVRYGLRHSVYDFALPVSEADKILTIVATSSDRSLVLQGKLISRG